jgi:hypothetical protein
LSQIIVATPPPFFFFLSYLIQNFSYTNFSLRISIRLLSSMLVRNVNVIILLLQTFTRALLPIHLTSINLIGLMPLLNTSFRYFTQVLLPKTKYLKYVPIGINLPLSTFYLTLRSLDLHLEGRYTPKTYLTSTTSTITNPYFSMIPICITPIAKKPYSYTLYKLLRMNLSIWFYWPPQYITKIHYTNITNQWYLLRFLNKYYMKVYNL